MGKRKQREQPRTQARDFREPRENVWKQSKTEGGDGGDNRGGRGFAEAVKDSAIFQAYYKAQNICPEGEWETMMESFRTPLPATFRINGTGKYAYDIRDMLKTKYFTDIAAHSGEVGDDDEPLSAPVPIAWYPDELAWQMRYSRNQLRRLPSLAGVHDFLKRANEYGSITRQEEVSMVPPFFLEVQPHHRVLDMCAAPGSKTFQLIESLHASDVPGAGTLPTGLVVANDSDLQRCNLLVHQTKRANSPALIVTNHEAQKFPLVRGLKGSADENGYRFDRVLCDVPCSGDGTLRKAPDLWKRWAPGMGVGLHNLQMRIFLHGCRLTRVGGKVVYSTCSMNPIENEAVVAEVLRQAKGAMVLEDVSHLHPKLKRNPGLKTWQVWDKAGHHPTYGPGEERNKQLLKSMFPDEESDAMPLERCMRVLPHLSDTGAFFIAVFTKVAELPGVPEGGAGKSTAADKEADPAADPAAAAEDGGAVDGGDGEDGAEKEEEAAAAAPAAVGAAAGKGEDWSRGGGNRNRAGGGKGGGSGRWGYLDPVVHVSDTDTQNALIEFFGIADTFPTRINLVTRTAEVAAPKRIYVVSEAVRQLLLADSRERLKITATGLLLFVKQDSKDSVESCNFRAAQEGIDVLLPHMTKQVVKVAAIDFYRLLKHRSLLFARADRAKDKPPFSVEEALKIAPLRSGCVVVVPEFPSDASFHVLAEKPEDMAVSCWKGAISLGANVNINEGVHLQERLALVFPEEVLKAADAKAAADFAVAVESGLITGPPPRESKAGEGEAKKDEVVVAAAAAEPAAAAADVDEKK